MKKKLLSIVLAISMICAFVPLVVSAETTATSGTCGDNVTWTLSDDGTLTISGTGKMENYLSGNSPFYYNKEIKSVIINEGVTNIGAGVFNGCSLNNITIPNSVTSIGNNAFMNSALTSVTIPSSVTSIGRWAFGVSALENITLPDSVTKIGQHAFARSRYEKNADNWEDGALYIGKHLIYTDNNEINSEYKIKDGTKTIADYAFYGCESITSIEIPNSVTSIGEDAFDKCSNLTSIEIPNSVTSIGDGAFEDCSNLTNVTILNCSSSIGSKTFKNCSNLANIVIPDSISNIECNAFDDTAYYNDKNNWKNGVLYVNNHLIKANSDEISVNYPIKAGTKTIADYAFEDCENITSIEMPNSITGIGKFAFDDCIGLTNITIPTGVTSIGDFAFSGCRSLTKINIPDSLTSIGYCVFGFCSSLISIKIPNSITSIDYSAFENCDSLTSIEIPNSVKSIGESAFENCESLADVYYGGSKTQWNAITIGDNNDCLKNATIHYQRIIPLTTAKVTTEKVGEAYTFNVEPATTYEDCYVYAAMYDENGVLTGFERVPLEMSGSTTVSVGKSDEAVAAKIFIMSDELQPVIKAQKFEIE